MSLIMTGHNLRERFLFKPISPLSFKPGQNREKLRTDDNQLRSPDDIMQVGDQYHWRWHQDLQTSGTILDVVENERLQFTFGDRTPDSDEKVIVTVTFKALDDTTSIVLKQENLPDDERSHVHWHMGCNMGWSFFMTNLKALLEHGVDLRELDSDRAYASRAITH
jgi:hypothetical protein